MRIVRDSAGFSLVGALQVVVDSSVFIFLTTFGAATAPSNICGRIAGALLGFWLNSRLTFAHHDQPRLRWRLMRYVSLWIVLTAISTVVLATIDAQAGLHRTWWAKPCIETVLGVTSFLISRHWVYRR